MANFVNLMLGGREVIINKDFIAKVDFCSHDTEQNVFGDKFCTQCGVSIFSRE